MTKTALIVVDMQNDFMEGGALAVGGAKELIPYVNQAMADTRFDVVVATQDWHPPNHGSFGSNHEAHEVGEVIDLNGLDQILWPDHCVQGTEGAEFVDGLDTSLFDEIFQKGTNPEVDSYSGFYDNGHREDTGLADWLREQDITAVAVVGVATDYCVKFTALDAVEEGFETEMLHNLSKGVNLSEGDVAKAMEEMKEAGATCTPYNPHL